MGIIIPKATPQLQTKLDQVSKITDKKQKAQYYADNPDIVLAIYLCRKLDK